MTSELRKVHDATGATRLFYSAGCSHIVSGGFDGSLSVTPTARWPKADAIWSASAPTKPQNISTQSQTQTQGSFTQTGGEDGAVISTVAYHPGSDKAATGTRSGHVRLHSAVSSSSEHTTKQLCRLSSEVRHLVFSQDGNQLIIAGDSVRVLSLSSIASASPLRVIPTNVPPPILSVALSQCEKWIALVSASGDIGVVPFQEQPTTKPSTAGGDTQQQEDGAATGATPQPPPQQSQLMLAANGPTQQPGQALKDKMFALPKQLPLDLRKDESVVPRLSWCTIPHYPDTTTTKQHKSAASDSNKKDDQDDADALPASSTTPTKDDDATKKSAVTTTTEPAQLVLCVPAEGGFRMFELRTTVTKHGLIPLGFVALPFDATVSSSKSTVSACLLYPHTKHKLQAVLLSSCPAVAGSRLCHVRIDRKKNTAMETAAHASPVTITDFGFNGLTGAIAFACSSGEVGYLKRFCVPTMHHNLTAAATAAAASAPVVDGASSSPSDQKHQQQPVQEDDDGGNKKHHQHHKHHGDNNPDEDDDDDDDHDPYDDDSSKDGDDSDASSSSDDDNSTTASEHRRKKDDNEKKTKRDKKNKKHRRHHDESSSSAEESDLDALLDDLVSSAPKYVSAGKRRRIRAAESYHPTKAKRGDGGGSSDDDDDDKDLDSDEEKLLKASKSQSQNATGIASVLVDEDVDTSNNSRGVKKKPSSRFVDDEAEDGYSSEDEDEDEFEDGYADQDDVDEDDDDFLEDDSSPSSSRRRNRRRGGAGTADHQHHHHHVAHRRRRGELNDDDDDGDAVNSDDHHHFAPLAEFAKPFQVGATEPDENGYCYHAFNSIGVIRSGSSDTVVAFHDKSRSVVRMTRPGTVCYAGLGPYGAAFLVAPPTQFNSESQESELVGKHTEAMKHYASYRRQQQQQQQRNNSGKGISADGDDANNQDNDDDDDAPLVDEADLLKELDADESAPAVAVRRCKRQLEQLRRNRLARARHEAKQFDLVFRAFQGLGGQPDWMMPVNIESEGSIRSLTVGKRFVALFTDRYLRLFSQAGWETAVIAMPHSVVCSSGINSMHAPSHMLLYGNNNKQGAGGGGAAEMVDPLVYCYQDAPGGAIYMRVLNVEKQEESLAPVQLPLKMVGNDSEMLVEKQSANDAAISVLNHNKARLSWIGWSDEGTLCVADNIGTVFSHTRDWGGSFQPIYDPARTASVEYTTPWVWHVTADKIWVYKRIAGQAYPPVTIEIPTPEMLSVCVPAIGAGVYNNTTWALRQHYLRLMTIANDLKRRSEFYTAEILRCDTQLDAVTRKLFELELRDEHTTKAIDLATTFQLQDSLEKATRYAHEHNHSYVCDKLIQLLQFRVKTKKKRLCQLPAEGSQVSEKERDRMLRQLLAASKNNAGGGGGGVGSTTDAAAAAASASASAPAPVAVERLPLQTSPGRKLSAVQSQGVVPAKTAPPPTLAVAAPNTTASNTNKQQQHQAAPTTTTKQHQQTAPAAKQQPASTAPAASKPSNFFSRAAGTTATSTAAVASNSPEAKAKKPTKFSSATSTATSAAATTSSSSAVARNLDMSSSSTAAAVSADSPQHHDDAKPKSSSSAANNATSPGASNVSSDAASLSTASPPSTKKSGGGGVDDTSSADQMMKPKKSVSFAEPQQQKAAAPAVVPAAATTTITAAPAFSTVVPKTTHHENPLQAQRMNLPSAAPDPVNSVNKLKELAAKQAAERQQQQPKSASSAQFAQALKQIDAGQDEDEESEAMIPVSFG